MHPVLEHLLEKKAENPADNKRKITLALFGGAMLSVRGAGALAALEELGLSQAFYEVYGMSSGFSNALYFLAGQAKLGASIYYEDISGGKFLNLFRFWEMVDDKYLLRVVKELKPLDVDKALESKTMLSTMLSNISEKKYEYLEIHDFTPRQILDLLRASLSLRVITNKSVKIRNCFYRDILSRKALLAFFKKILSSDAADILALYNYPWQMDYVRKKMGNFDRERVMEVCLGGKPGHPQIIDKLRKFKTGKHWLREECQKSGDLVKKIFGGNKPVELL